MEIIKERKSRNAIKVTAIQILGHKEQGVIGLKQVFERLKHIPDTSDQYKFTYWVNKNLDTLKAGLKPLEKDIESKMEMLDKKQNQEYSEKIAAVKEKFADKNEDGSLVVVDNKINISNKEGFEKEINEVQVEYAVLLDSIKEFNQYVFDKEAEDISVTPFKLYRDNLPKGLTPTELDLLEKFLS